MIKRVVSSFMFEIDDTSTQNNISRIFFLYFCDIIHWQVVSQVVLLILCFWIDLMCIFVCVIHLLPLIHLWWCDLCFTVQCLLECLASSQCDQTVARVTLVLFVLNVVISIICELTFLLTVQDYHKCCNI